MRVELELRNLPLERIMEYLVQVGGQRRGDRMAAGEGWTASLRQLDPARIGSLSVPRDLLVIEGEPSSVDLVHAFMRRQTMRGGG